MKIAVFLPNWLGDVAMATPALRALRRRFGTDAKIVGIMRPYLADVLKGTNWLDEQWFFNPRADDRELRCRAVARRMRGERFDIAVLTTNSLRTAWVAWRGGAKRRVGYVRYARGPLLTDKIYPRREGHWQSQWHTRIGNWLSQWRPIVPEPMVDSYLRLAYAAGCEDESPRLELTTVEADERSADGVFQSLGIGERPIVALNSSGAYGGAKLWPVEYFGGLARNIADELGYDVLVCCGPKEREIARKVVELADGSDDGDCRVRETHRSGKGDENCRVRETHRDLQGAFHAPYEAAPRVVSMADQPMDLGTAKACIRRCRAMVSTDSGPRHVAAALGLPVVTMFGPMLPIWSENPTQRAANLVLDLDCIGCHKRVCPLGHHRCMRDLSVETVFNALRELLETQ